jgi:hypothetical protein
MFSVRYELGFYIPEDDILRSHRRENLKFYIVLIGGAQYRRRNMFLLRYELDLYIPDDGIPHNYRRENFSFI